MSIDPYASPDPSAGQPFAAPSGEPGYGSAPQPPAQPPYGYPDPSAAAPPPQYGVPQYGGAPYGQPQYGGAPYGQPQYGGAPYGQPQYGQPYGPTQGGVPQYAQPPYGAAQYGVPHYGQPQYPFTQVGGHPPYRGMAISSFVVALVALLIGWIPGLSTLLAVLGVVFGHVALSQFRRDPAPRSGRGLAIAGLVIGYVAVALSLLAWIGYASYMNL